MVLVKEMQRYLEQPRDDFHKAEDAPAKHRAVKNGAEQQLLAVVPAAAGARPLRAAVGAGCRCRSTPKGDKVSDTGVLLSRSWRGSQDLLRLL